MGVENDWEEEELATSEIYFTEENEREMIIDSDAWKDIAGMKWTENYPKKKNLLKDKLQRRK